MKIEKTASLSTAKVGQPLTYTLTTYNVGTVDHKGTYYVTDTIPAGISDSDLDMASITNGGGSYNSTTRVITWTNTADFLMNTTKTYSFKINAVPFVAGGTNLVNKAGIHSALSTDAYPPDNNFRLSTPVYANLWIGSTSSTDWNTPTNWTNGQVPADGKDVGFAKNGVNYDADVINDLVLDQNRTIGNLTNNTSKKLTIPAGKTLTVNGVASTNTIDPENRILIQSDANVANGSLIFTQPTSNQDVHATVEMWSKGYKGPAGSPWVGLDGKTYRTFYRWQYFGIPVVSSAISGSIGSFIVAQYDESKDLDIRYEKWIVLGDGSPLTATKGYAITQEGTTPRKIVFLGKLVVGDRTLTLTSTASTTAGSINYYSGRNLISNPFTAPINISSLTFPAGFDETVYLFNTGSFNEWGVNQAKGGDNWSTDSGLPGTYFGIPKNIGGFISSMQGFMLKGPVATGALYTMTLPYGTTGLVGNMPMMKVTSSVSADNKAETESVGNPSDFSYMSVEATGKTEGGDRVWLFSQQGTSHDFDNGWDARKIDYSPWINLHATEASGDYQVNTADNLDGTFLSFKAGNDTEYTLRIRKANLKGYSSLTLTDLVTRQVVDLSSADDISYPFIASNTVTASKRFLISGTKTENAIGNNGKDISPSQLIKVFSAGKFVKINNRTDENGTYRISDMVGNLVLTGLFNADSMTEINTTLPEGVYNVQVKTATINLTEKIVIRK